MSFQKFCLATLVFAGMIAVGSSAAVCSNATLKGVYGVLGTGLNSSGQPATSVYQITADGAGNITGLATKSKDGAILNYTFTGTYLDREKLHGYGDIYQSGRLDRA